MGSKNITCSVLRSIWSCTKDETKSLTGQKSDFAFSALEAGGGGSCWAQFSNAPLLLFYQQFCVRLCSGSFEAAGHRVYPVTCPALDPPTIPIFALCTGTSSNSCGISLQALFSPSQELPFFPCQPPDSSYPASAFAGREPRGLWAPFASPWYSCSSTAHAVTFCDQL